MRLSTNFASPATALLPIFAVSLWMLALALFAMSLWFVRDGVALRSETGVLRERLSKLDEKVGAKRIALPPESELSALRLKVKRLNELSGFQGWPLSVLLSKLERIVPDGVQVVRLHDRPLVGEVTLTVGVVGQDALTVLLERLQKEVHFSEVLLAKQSQQETRTGRQTLFELQLKEVTE